MTVTETETEIERGEREKVGVVAGGERGGVRGRVGVVAGEERGEGREKAVAVAGGEIGEAGEGEGGATAVSPVTGRTGHQTWRTRETFPPSARLQSPVATIPGTKRPQD